VQPVVPSIGDSSPYSSPRSDRSSQFIYHAQHHQHPPLYPSPPVSVVAPTPPQREAKSEGEPFIKSKTCDLGAVGRKGAWPVVYHTPHTFHHRCSVLLVLILKPTLTPPPIPFLHLRRRFRVAPPVSGLPQGRCPPLPLAVQESLGGIMYMEQGRLTRFTPTYPPTSPGILLSGGRHAQGAPL